MVRARAGDGLAFEELLRPRQARLYRTVLRITGNEADAADVYQTAALTAFRKLDGFRGDAAFGTWLYQIAVNAALTHRRSRSAHEVPMPDDDLPRFDWMGRHAAPVANWVESAESTVGRRELRTILGRALNRLPAVDRAIVWLKDGEGLSHGDIAATTGLTVLAVRSRLHRARLRLRAQLADQLGSVR